MEGGDAKVAGRAEEVGRPMLYGTTKEFLEVFGLATLDDLPNAKDLRPAPEKRAKVIPTETTEDEAPDSATGIETSEPSAVAEIDASDDANVAG